MKRGQARIQDGCGFPTRFAIVSLTLRDGVSDYAADGGVKEMRHG
jgi:hypothetical protein